MPTGTDAPRLVRPEAAALVEPALGSRRILVTGATGWFGSTAVALLAAAGRDPRADDVLLVASRDRTHDVPGTGPVPVRSWTDASVEAFAPEIVLNLAFLTRDKAAALGTREYAARVEQLTRRLLTAAALPSVERVVTVSSGAAVGADGSPEQDADANPYGWAKAREETAVRAMADERGLAATVLRAWAVSGPFVTRPSAYLFSSLVEAACRSVAGGDVRVESSAAVWRRYSAVDDALAVALASPGTAVLDTGGPLVEAGALAERVVELLAPRARVVRDRDTTLAEDRYHASGDRYEARCRELGLDPTGLDEQIRRTALLVGARP